MNANYIDNEDVEEKKRHRNVAHLWCDKQVIRFFRQNFDKNDYKNLRSVYLALCEIDSDFGENSDIYSFVKTVATYAGMNRNTVHPYLQALRNAGIIDYSQQKDNDSGQFKGSKLIMYKWEQEGQDEKVRIIVDTLNKPSNNRKLKKQHTGNRANREIGNNKNNILLSLSKNNIKLSKYKNPTEVKSSENISIKTKQITENNKLNKSDDCPYNKIKDMYNSICTSLPKVKSLSAERKKVIYSRWKQNGYNLDVFDELFHQVQNSKFMTGYNGRNWKADFDWIMNENNMIKTLEGKYDDNKIDKQIIQWYKDEQNKNRRKNGDNYGFKPKEIYL